MYHLVTKAFYLNKQYIIGEYISEKLIRENPEFSDYVSPETYDLILG